MRSATLSIRSSRGVRSAFIHSRYLDWKPRRARHTASQEASRVEGASLVGSCEGAFAEVFLSLPWWLFDPPRDPDRAIPKYVKLLHALLAGLPASTRFVIMVNRRCRPQLEDWLVKVGARIRSRIIETPDDRKFTLWAEDAFGLCRSRNGKLHVILSDAMNRLDDPEVGVRLARRLRAPVRRVPYPLGGGNALIGDDFWLIGVDDTVRHFRPRRTDGVRLLGRATERAYRTTLDAKRRIIAVGCRSFLPGFRDCCLGRPTTVGGQAWTEVVYRGNAEGTRQPLYHLDLFIAMAGRDSGGRCTILVGDPRLAARMAGLALPDHAMPEAFDEIAALLAAVPDFRVVRNPLPLVYVDTARERLREWYFASANNVLVQTEPAEVWLPTYGCRPWPELKKTDAANIAIWRSLGYRVHRLPDCHPLAYSLGGPNCIKKVLRRGSGGRESPGTEAS